MKTKKSLVFGFLTVVLALALIACPNGPLSDDDENTGSITGRAVFTDTSTGNSGITITLERTSGLFTASVVQIGRSITNGGSSNTARSVTASAITGADGSFTISNVPFGNYILYASSQNSLEKAVYANVNVTSNIQINIGILPLTPVGNISGRITVNGSSANMVATGFLVSVAGTSYMAMTNLNGEFTITGVPAGSYTLIIMKGIYTELFYTTQGVTVTVTGGQTHEIQQARDIDSDDLNKAAKIEIKDGYWWINDKNTGVKAEGIDGSDGRDGNDGNHGENGNDCQCENNGECTFNLIDICPHPNAWREVETAAGFLSDGKEVCVFCGEEFVIPMLLPKSKFQDVWERHDPGVLFPPQVLTITENEFHLTDHAMTPLSFRFAITSWEGQENNHNHPTFTKALYPAGYRIMGTTTETNHSAFPPESVIFIYLSADQYSLWIHWGVGFGGGGSRVFSLRSSTELPEPVTDLEYILNVDSVSLTWSVPQYATGFKAFVTEVDTDNQRWSQDNFFSTSATVFSGLTYGVTYKATVVAWNKNGDGAPSNEVIFTYVCTHSWYVLSPAGYYANGMEQCWRCGLQREIPMLTFAPVIDVTVTSPAAGAIVIAGGKISLTANISTGSDRLPLSDVITWKVSTSATNPDADASAIAYINGNALVVLPTVAATTIYVHAIAHNEVSGVATVTTKAAGTPVVFTFEDGKLGPADVIGNQTTFERSPVVGGITMTIAAASSDWRPLLAMSAANEAPSLMTGCITSTGEVGRDLVSFASLQGPFIISVIYSGTGAANVATGQIKIGNNIVATGNPTDGNTGTQGRIVTYTYTGSDAVSNVIGGTDINGRIFEVRIIQ